MAGTALLPAYRHVNTPLPRPATRGMLWDMTSIAVHCEATRRVARDAMRRMMFMMMMPMMHRQPSL
ncbi:hypothetical protein [Brachybacterium alimentarium]|uniref:hypothetical protein n=1 Tax=Brachybacterium alimentarium TaxID=47845 RepID=UPI003FD015AB